MTEHDQRSPETHRITQLLREASGGDGGAFSNLLPLVYEHLKEIAAGRLRWERDGHTLNATALVHEAYLKLVDQSSVEWQSRAHFYAVASQAMRRILIDYAKTRHRAKRGGKGENVPLELVGDVPDGRQAEDDRFTELLELDRVMTALGSENARAAEIVQYRVFGGLKHHEIAEVLGVSEATVRRSWKFAKLWLRRELGDDVQAASSLFVVEMPDEG
jgi:RNA polymerase sigma factor (TIGR02999 family)